MMLEFYVFEVDDWLFVEDVGVFSRPLAVFQVPVGDVST